MNCVQLGLWNSHIPHIPICERVIRWLTLNSTTGDLGSIGPQRVSQQLLLFNTPFETKLNGFHDIFRNYVSYQSTKDATTSQVCRHWVGQTVTSFQWSRHWSLASPAWVRRLIKIIIMVYLFWQLKSWLSSSSSKADTLNILCTRNSSEDEIANVSSRSLKKTAGCDS